MNSSKIATIINVRQVGNAPTHLQTTRITPLRFGLSRTLLVPLRHFTRRLLLPLQLGLLLALLGLNALLLSDLHIRETTWKLEESNAPYTILFIVQYNAYNRHCTLYSTYSYTACTSIILVHCTCTRSSQTSSIYDLLLVILVHMINKPVQLLV